MAAVTTAPTRPTAVLAVLFVAAFAMDSAEMIVVGMLDLIADGLDVSVPAAGAPRVVAILALCCLVFAGVQSALTYLVPYLDEVAGVTGAGATLFLLLYGVSTSIGSAAGGRFAAAAAVVSLATCRIRPPAALVSARRATETPELIAA